MIGIEVLLTALEGISHHDPAQSAGSNTLTFNRRKQFVARAPDLGEITQAQIDAFCAAHPVPATLADVIRELSFAEFVGATMVRALIEIYGSGDGAGLFAGVERYVMLETRLRAAGARARSLRHVWDIAARDLLLPVHDAAYDAVLIQLFALPRSVQMRAISAMVANYRSLVAVARLWVSEQKRMNEAYALAAQMELLREPAIVATFDAAAIEEMEDEIPLDTPHVSGNTARHQLVRAPAWAHLCGALDMTPEDVVLAPAAEAIFSNGGNIKSGAKQPQNAALLSRHIREAYPTLDLLGGVTDAFDLGPSRLQMSSWIVCRENAAALENSIAADLPQMRVSVFDMLDDVTATRQASVHGVGQMIYNFETLCAGSVILARMTLDSFTSPRTASALAAALREYERRATIAGQAARGFGHVAVGEFVGDLPPPDEYEAYLSENREQLRAWILDGTLGAGVVVCS